MFASVLPLLLILAAGAALLALHFLIWGAIYRPRLESDALLTATAADGWQLAIAHFCPPSPKPGALPVILCHGLAVNRLNLMFPGTHSLAGFLRARGYEVFVCDLRGSGDSRRPPPTGPLLRDVDFDRHLFLDGPAVLAKALEVSGASRAFWVGHSMGGLLGMAMAELEHAPQLAGVVALGSPTHFGSHRAYLHLLLRWVFPFSIRGRMWQRWVARLFSPYVYFLPLLGDIVLNPKNTDARLARRVGYVVLDDVSRSILEQFEGWMRRDAWDTRSPVIDLRAGLSKVACPVLLIAGSSDVLAPPAAVRTTLVELGTADKTLMVLGRERGDKQEYGHGDLIFGARAPDEVFPAVSTWLDSHLPA